MAILRGDGFILRPFRRGDEESLRRNIDDKRVARYTLNIPHPYGAKAAKAWVEKNLALAKSRRPQERNFALVIDGEVVGGVGLCHIDGHKAELGYWLAPVFWGRGIMTGAARLVTDYGFKELKLLRVYACVFPPNKASARVLEKLGFAYEGRMRKAVIKDGVAQDDLVYAKVR